MDKVTSPPLTPTFRSVAPFVVMCIGMFMALLDIQIVASSLEVISGGLSAGQDQIGWLQTAYLIAEIIIIPMSGWLTQVFSTRGLFLISSMGFTVASILCGLSWNIESMIVFRALQGMLGASMIPLVMASSFHYFPGKNNAIAAAVISTIASLAPALGPLFGGWLTEFLSWHWLFFINLIPGVVVSLGVASWVDIDKPRFELIKNADYLGFLLMALFLGNLEYVLEEGARWNWLDDVTIRNASWLSGISFILFVWRSLACKNPIVDLTALTIRNFSIGCILSFITGVGLFATIYLVPLFLAYIQGYSAFQVGIALSASGLGALLGVPLYMFANKKIKDGKKILMLGFISICVSMLLFSRITSVWGEYEFFWPQLLRGMTIIFTIAPVVTYSLGELSVERRKYASGLFNMMRNLGGAVGIALCGVILNNRTNLHFEHIANSLNAANFGLHNAFAAMQQYFQLIFGDISRATTVTLMEVRALAYREAATMAYADAFLMIFSAFLLGLLLVPLLREPQQTL